VRTAEAMRTRFTKHCFSSITVFRIGKLDGYTALELKIYLPLLITDINNGAHPDVVVEEFGPV
jgi:hypothetical protein